LKKGDGIFNWEDYLQCPGHMGVEWPCDEEKFHLEKIKDSKIPKFYFNNWEVPIVLCHLKKTGSRTAVSAKK